MEEENKENGGLTRRTFFKWVTGGIGSFLAVVIGYPLITSLVSNSKAIIKSTSRNLTTVGKTPYLRN